MGVGLRILSKLDITPHICISCRSGDTVRDWFLDTGIEVEWEGRIFLCRPCLENLVNYVPFLFTQNDLTEIVNLQNKAVNEAKVINDKYNAAKESLLSIGVDLDLLTEFKVKNGTDFISGDEPVGTVDIDEPDVGEPDERSDEDYFEPAETDSNSNPLLDLSF